MKKQHEAWAIYANTNEGHGLIGQYWQFNIDRFSIAPRYMQGTKTALFKTRKIAREHLPSVKRAFPKAKVVKVIVTIEWHP